MSRYLTPSKVGLLALVSLYTESVVPFDATIPVLSFISSHLLKKEASASSLPQRDDFVIDIETLQIATGRFASGIPGRTIWDLLLKKLWGIDSLDSLHHFFDNLSFLLGPPEEPARANTKDPISGRLHLSRVSPLGSFVRRARIEFNRLQFHDGAGLWNAFVAFRAPSFTQWKKRNPLVVYMAFDENLVSQESEAKDRLTALVYGDVKSGLGLRQTLSSADIERILELQVDQMQRESLSLSWACC